MALALAACSGEPAPGAPPDPASPGPEASPQSAPGSSPSPVPSPLPDVLRDARHIGQVLAQVEAEIVDPQVSPARIEELGRMQQRIYRLLAYSPSWHGEALAEMPPELRRVAEDNLEAGSELLALTRPQQSLPDWRIVAPPPPEELLGYYREAEAEFAVPWQYLAAIHLVESRMGRIRGSSPAGAQGPMQFIPSTWAAYGQGDINDPRDAIMAAGRYLAAAGAPGNMERALHAYNPTPRYVKAISLYAQQMMNRPAAYFGYYHWQVYYRTVDGDVELPVGYFSRG